MGIESSAAAFLIASKRVGVAFDRSITIGRQSVNFGPASLRTSLKRAGLQVSAERQQAIFEGDGYAEAFLSALGATSTDSLDNSHYEAATHVVDLNLPIDDTLKCKFSAVIDSGSTEHVFNYPQAIKNCMEMVEIGGHYLGIVPTTNLSGHGFYQFSVELMYRIFSSENGFETERVYIAAQEPGALWLRAPDPASIGARVEYQSSRPAYIYVRARRTAVVPIFRKYPQQSDYVGYWQRELGDHIRRRGRKAKMIQILAGGLPDPVKRLISRVLAATASKRATLVNVDIFSD